MKFILMARVTCDIWEEGWNWHLFSGQKISPKPKIQKRGGFRAFQ
jgi:hypothetical protein